jgi:hypothetical protein
MNAERHARRDLGERRFGALAACQAVGENADLMAARGLTVGKIKDVADDSADRRADRVKNAKRRLIGRGHSLKPSFADNGVAGFQGAWRAGSRAQPAAATATQRRAKTIRRKRRMARFGNDSMID